MNSENIYTLTPSKSNSMPFMGAKGIPLRKMASENKLKLRRPTLKLSINTDVYSQKSSNSCKKNTYIPSIASDREI